MTGRNDGTVVAHTAARITVALNQPLSQAVARFEELVPAVDIDAFRQSRSWDETILLARTNGPLGLMRFWKLDYAAILAGSGTPGRSSERCRSRRCRPRPSAPRDARRRS